MSENRPSESDSLPALLGGRRGAIDASLPPVGFAIGWIVTQSIPVAVGCAVIVGIGVSAHRMWRGARPIAALISLGGVVLAGLIALWTGHPEDFFILQLLSNGGSALAWMGSIAIRWPFLGLIVGTALRQRTGWRRDPALVRAYCLASWVWVCQYLVRLAVFIPLWYFGWVGALSAARVALTWPLVAACIAGSWWVFKRSLPADHPGIRHPVDRDSVVDA